MSRFSRYTVWSKRRLLGPCECPGGGGYLVFEILGRLAKGHAVSLGGVPLPSEERLAEKVSKTFT